MIVVYALTMKQADRKKAVFLDIDGTLFIRGQGPFKDDLDAMKKAALKGHYLFLNTGRSYANIHKVLLELGLFKGIVAGCGAHILFALPGDGRSYETFYDKWISEKNVRKLIGWYKKQAKCCILEGHLDCYVVNRSLWPGIGKNVITIKSFAEIKRKNPGEKITKFTLEGNASEDERSFLEPLFSLHCFPNYSEGIVKGESKGKAIEIVLEKLGLRREDSIAIGDSANDLDMLRSAGLGIAMGNAPDEIKAAAGAVTGECGSGGVAQALKKYVI